MQPIGFLRNIKPIPSFICTMHHVILFTQTAGLHSQSCLNAITIVFTLPPRSCPLDQMWLSLWKPYLTSAYLFCWHEVSVIVCVAATNSVTRTNTARLVLEYFCILSPIVFFFPTQTTLSPWRNVCDRVTNFLNQLKNENQCGCKLATWTQGHRWWNVNVNSENDL